MPIKRSPFTRLKSKYKAKPTVIDDIRFASKSEAMMYCQIKNLKQIGIVSHFFCQVPIRLPGGIKYILDFMLIYPDMSIRYIDCKGRKGGKKLRTPVYILKKKQVESLYPIVIEEDL